MALSRFWSWLIAGSIVYILYLLFTGGIYSLGQLVNGKMSENLLVTEYPLSQLQQRDTGLANTLLLSKEFRSNDTTYRLAEGGTVQVAFGKQAADGIFPTCKNVMLDLWLPLIGYLTFFCGLLNLLNDSNAITGMSSVLSPFFSRVFPELPKGHPAYGFMTMNFAANFLGLDNAATPFGLKAMESMQEANASKERASNSQIMFLCLHAAGLTLIPTSIIGYRAAQNAANPADVMIPCIITSFIGTLAALILVSIRQRINLLNLVVLGVVALTSAVIGGLLFYVAQLDGLDKIHFTGNLSNLVLLVIILLIVAFAIYREKQFSINQTNIFESFIHGAKDGFTTGVRVLPYMIAMLVALSIFRNSGLMHIIMGGISTAMGWVGVDKQIIDAIPVALMRPFSPGGSRGFMLDAMKSLGPDSFAGRLSCLFQGAAETTFYVIALYFGSVNVKDSRYTLGIMLTVDLVCVITAIFVCKLYF